MNIPNLEQITARDPLLGEALRAIASGVENVGRQTNAPTQLQAAEKPGNIASVSVTAKDGIFHAQITDNSPVKRGLEYHLEYSTDPGFRAPIVIHNGASRDFRGKLGNQKLYWRAYSQYPTSDPSQVVYYGGAASPLPVTGGGSESGPPVPQSKGSGTAPSTGLQGGAGWGTTQARNTGPASDRQKTTL